jgi:hypothetical protein
MNPSERLILHSSCQAGKEMMTNCKLSMTDQNTEEWKWGPVFSHKGLVCSIGTFKDHIKINFFKGANLPDPASLFNAGFEAKKTRAIDLYEGDKVNKTALKDIIHSAIDQNR